MTKPKDQVQTVRVFPVEEMSIDEIKPYWRNPRRVPEEAVGAVAESIRNYGYQQPIVVDTDHVIIIGHTRYAAMRRLNVTTVPVMVADLPPDKVKQLRVIDNRTSEFSSWDFEALMVELADLDGTLMSAYFPEIDTEGMDAAPTTQSEGRPWEEVDPLVEFVCPSCFHTFDMDVTREAVMSGKPLSKEKIA